MNPICAVLLLALIPASTALNCYLCASGATGCNDPFSATATNVTTTGPISANLFCVKQGVTSSLISRYGAPTCTNTGFVLGVGIACCQSDLCNGAQANYQFSILAVALTALIMFFKFH